MVVKVTADITEFKQRLDKAFEPVRDILQELRDEMDKLVSEDVDS